MASLRFGRQHASLAARNSVGGDCDTVCVVGWGVSSTCYDCYPSRFFHPCCSLDLPLALGWILREEAHPSGAS